MSCSGNPYSNGAFDEYHERKIATLNEHNEIIKIFRKNGNKDKVLNSRIEKLISNNEFLSSRDIDVLKDMLKNIDYEERIKNEPESPDLAWW